MTLATQGSWQNSAHELRSLECAALRRRTLSEALIQSIFARVFGKVTLDQTPSPGNSTPSQGRRDSCRLSQCGHELRVCVLCDSLIPTTVCSTPHGTLFLMTFEALRWTLSFRSCRYCDKPGRKQYCHPGSCQPGCSVLPHLSRRLGMASDDTLFNKLLNNFVQLI